MNMKICLKLFTYVKTNTRTMVLGHDQIMQNINC